MNKRPTPYFNESGDPRLEQSVIVVADILGYSAMIESASKEGKLESLLKKIHDSLGKALRNISDPTKAKSCLKLWSDNFILGFPMLGGSKGAWELSEACNKIGHFQRDMAIDGLFIRGGISIDSIHISENLIFGMVLKELKTAEGQSHYPRIVLLDSTMNYLNTRPNIKNSLLSEGIMWNDGSDGEEFINYLYPLGIGLNGQRRKQIEIHKQHVESNLKRYESIGKIRQKYKWLADYHNRFCRESDFRNSPEYIIEA